MTGMTKKENSDIQQLRWTDEHQEIFQLLKDALITPPVLANLSD